MAGGGVKRVAIVVFNLAARACPAAAIYCRAARAPQLSLQRIQYSQYLNVCHILLGFQAVI